MAPSESVFTGLGCIRILNTWRVPRGRGVEDPNWSAHYYRLFQFSLSIMIFTVTVFNLLPRFILLFFVSRCYKALLRQRNKPMYINKSFINLTRIERTMFAFRIIGGLHKYFFFVRRATSRKFPSSWNVTHYFVRPTSFTWKYFLLQYALIKTA